MIYVFLSPRKALITAPGAVHHVMSRGIDGRPLFRGDEDRRGFLSYLEHNIVKSGYSLYVWVGNRGKKWPGHHGRILTKRFDY